MADFILIDDDEEVERWFNRDLVAEIVYRKKENKTWVSIVGEDGYRKFDGNIIDKFTACEYEKKMHED